MSIAATYVLTRAVSPWTAVRVVDQSTSATEADRSRDGSLLRVGCYNIAHGRGSGDGNFNGEDAKTRHRRLVEMAEFLAACDLDVVVLNEVDFDSAWSGGVNQAEAIAAHAGFPHRVEQRNFDVNAIFFRLKFGNAILSRHPIVEAHAAGLPGDAWWETLFAGKKTGSVATIALPSGERVRIFAVHLSYRSEDVRIASVRAMLAESRRGESPMIVAGDFNSTPVDFPEADPSGKSAFAEMLSHGDWTTQPTEFPLPPDFTFSSTQPSRVIDWILSPRGWELLNRQVYPLELSDHRPVIAALRRSQMRPQDSAGTMQMGPEP